MSQNSDSVQTGSETRTDAAASNFHVCFICPYIYGYLNPGSQKTVGGAERQQHLLATRLQETGSDVSFITFEDGGDTYEQIDGFDVWKTLPTTNDVRQAPNMLRTLVRSIRRVDADVFYVRGNPPLCILSSYCCTVLGEIFVYCVANDSNIELARLSDHHGVFQYTVPKLTYIDAIRRSDAVVAQTEYQQNILENVFGIRSDIVPNVYSIPPQEDILAAADRSFVLWVGSLDPEQKRPMRFVRLAERLPAVEFVLIGWSQDDEFRTRISNRADSLSNLRYEGFVPPDEIDRYYRKATMFVNTSEYEGFPNTFLEAWRFGVPVVSLHHTLDGLLSEGDVGLHAGSVDTLTQQVARLWDNPETAAELGHNGREYLRNQYSVDIAFEKYTDLFAEACD